MRTFERPNVLLIYTDQQRWDSLGCYGNRIAKTPNIDKLAEEGVRFDNYFVQNPVCMPSRMSFLTGRYCTSLGIGTNGIPFPEDALPINQILKPYGYCTAQIGKLHFQPHAKRNHRDPHPTYGFDTFILSDEPGCYDDAYIKWVEAIDPSMVDKVRTSLPPAAFKYNQKSYTTLPRETHEPYVFEGEEDFTHTAFVTSEICRYLEYSTDAPFFAIAGFYAPHPPINPPQRFVDMYDPKQMPLPKLDEGERYSHDLQSITPERWQEIRAYYMALVSHIDDCVGKILDTLKRTGKEDNTIVIFTSDHGEYLGDHGRIQKGAPGHDCIIRVPFIMRYPSKIPAGLVINEFVEAVDIVPTILDYCGVQIPRVIQGKSIRPVIEGRERSLHEDVFMEYFVPFGNRVSTIRTMEYKYSCDSSGKELLYDLIEDPYELRNMATVPRYKDILADMRKRIIVRMHKAVYNCHEQLAEY